jgi:hypothetical protein
VTYRIDPELYRNVQGLVAAGEYTSLEEFLERAIRTQLTLEVGESERTLVSAPGSKHQAPPPLAGSDAAKRILATFSLPAEKMSLPPAMPSVDSPDAPIFGQVNRIVPIKIACRRIAVVALGSSSWPSIVELLRELVESAALVGSVLHEGDVAAGRKREQLAIGLPRQDNDDSKERFLSQVVARVVRGGTVHPGAIAAFGLAAFSDGMVGLTSTGVQFARMHNPVLDVDPRSAGGTLSIEEQQFFIEHVAKKLPSELQDCRLVVDAIVDGCVTPETLHARLAPKLSERRWTPAMVRTHLSGLVSRMVDLAIVERAWEGRNVSYSVGINAGALREAPRKGKNGRHLEAGG